MSFLSSTRTNSPHANVSRLTDSYHQAILSLAEASNTGTEISWQVTQHVLDRVWSTTSSSNIDASSSATVTDDAVIYACQGCGYLLHPGWKGTNLRVKRFNNGSSSIRRRKQRKRRKIARAEEMKAKDNRNNCRRASFGNTKKISNCADAATTTADLQQRLVLLRDDESCTTDRSIVRNNLVLTCGRCRDKTHLKGLLQQQLKTTSSHLVGPIFKKMTSSTTSFIVGSSGDGIENLADNFEPLPPARSSYQVNNRKKKHPPSPQVAMAASIAATIATSSRTKASLLSSPSTSLLEQKRKEQFGEQKRKKKAKSISSDKKTGNLLDFLSSLNDN
jgi:hypothetical protein